MVIDMALALANAVMGATFTGVARAAFEAALDYTHERVQGGEPHLRAPARAEAAVRHVHAGRGSRQLSRAACVYNQPSRHRLLQYSIASKTFCTQARSTSRARRCRSSGATASREYPIEKLFRDARASLIEDGSNDVLALVAARHLLANVPAERAARAGGRHDDQREAERLRPLASA